MEENQSLLELQVDQNASTNIMELSRWGKFLALMVMVGMGLIFLLCIFLWSRMSATFIPKDDLTTPDSGLAQVFLIAVLLVAGVIVGILMTFLVKAANRMRLGIQNRDQILFNSGLASLKNYFAMYGVLALLGLFFSLLTLISK